LVEAGGGEADQFMKESAAASDLVRGIAPYIELSSPTLAADLDSQRQSPLCKAVRARFEGHPDREILTRPATLEGLGRVADTGLVFEFLVSSFHLADIPKVYDRVPNLKAIVEHMGKPDVRGGSDWLDWKEQIQRLATETPVQVKLSLGGRLEDLAELVAHPGRGWDVEKIRPFVQWLVECFGTERLIWGSDWPLILMESDYKGTLAAMRQALGPISTQDERAIFRTNAIAFYALPQ
jgi:L-fuconolactonase